ncbi:MAG: adenosylcobinamide-phosphate synthase CbiB [Sneathiella sp.]
MILTSHSAFYTPTLIVLIALIVDALVGDPKRLYRIVPHPVVILGNCIARLEANFNLPENTNRCSFWLGALVTVGIVGAVTFVGYVLAIFLNQSIVTMILLAVLASSLLAWRGLSSHVKAVAECLDLNLEEGRKAVSHIVGRDPKTLDESGVSRAAIESLAENFSDGTVAPLFWFTLLGLPGLCGYKAVNTLDSMIGHRNDRYEYFGKLAARIDDVVNYIPARITGIFIVLSAFTVPAANGRNALRVMLEDGQHHRSVNAGWPEAAMAGALDVALAGPRQYAGEKIEDRWMNKNGERSVGTQHIRNALKIYRTAGVLIILVLLAATGGVYSLT